MEDHVRTTIVEDTRPTVSFALVFRKESDLFLGSEDAGAGAVAVAVILP